MYNLMIVEAPPKAKKIESILKKEGLIYKVVATAGYIKDLPRNEYALNFNEKDLKVKWVYSEGKKQLINNIKELASKANSILISTDDDREGERIASDVIKELDLKKGQYQRVVFTAITKSKILEAIKNPREIRNKKVTSAITRRILDREIGYPVSEILRWDLRQKGYEIPNNLGCGRTISPTLHILNENQKSIDGFTKEQYYRIKVWYLKDGVNFFGIHEVKFMKDSNDNMEQLKLVLEQMRLNRHTVIRHTPKNKEVSPPPALTTVTLQQSASNIYGLKGKETMELAQLLYYLGYISYHRTDSIIQSEETYLEIIDYLGTKYSEDDILPTKRNFKETSKNTQEGHESIRPTTINEEFHPDNIKKYWIEQGQWETEQKEEKNKRYCFNNKHLWIYEIIWYRTLAVQMRNAVYDASETVVDISGNKITMISNRLKTTKLYDGGEKILSGWLSLKATLLKKSTMVEETDYVNDEKYIPTTIEGEELHVVDITLLEEETRAPYHYGEGRLIKKIDSAGIVRPSTLATVLPSLESKKCIYYVGNSVRITRLGQIVDDWVSEHVFWLNDLEMAQKFEETLDAISSEDIENISDTDFIMEYHERIENLKETLGYTNEINQEVAEWQIEKALKIAQSIGIELGDEILNDRNKLEIFLANNAPRVELDSLGKCPACKKGKVKENEKAFGCSEFKNGCKFVLWKKNMSTFFEIFGAQITNNYLISIIIAALKKEPLLYTGLISKKNESFDAFIDIKFNKEKELWGLGLKFDNEKKENLEKEQIVKVDSLDLNRVLKNYKTENELLIKLSALFNKEGSASLCYGKILIPELPKININDIDELGLEIKENIKNKNSILYINEKKTIISILSYQPSSKAFIELLDEVYRIISVFEKTNMLKIACGAEFRRFCETIEQLEENINNYLVESINLKDFEIIYKRNY
ncbi:type IA DNA topoisomerase [Aliarcobacter butzleri]|uniref:type IA DNA topoisomerase n=1 Tax=Aliarcobacter butzleri TaxID=28197 RepID=UPI0021B27ADC|nr:DNA topoisomerase [Aliarcobacter butzleri]MCT7578657.1 DNA topoisomerase [Aliarcobacter butzleri]MCT7647599.1 DNA topoisomerase [Aliarcobacter butzleri]